VLNSYFEKKRRPTTIWDIDAFVSSELREPSPLCARYLKRPEHYFLIKALFIVKLKINYNEAYLKNL
jgi:hypothetical protein